MIGNQFLEVPKIEEPLHIVHGIGRCLSEMYPSLFGLVRFSAEYQIAYAAVFCYPELLTRELLGLVKYELISVFVIYIQEIHEYVLCHIIYIMYPRILMRHDSIIAVRILRYLS